MRADLVHCLRGAHRAVARAVEQAELLDRQRPDQAGHHDGVDVGVGEPPLHHFLHDRAVQPVRQLAVGGRRRVVADLLGRVWRQQPVRQLGKGKQLFPPHAVGQLQAHGLAVAAAGRHRLDQELRALRLRRPEVALAAIPGLHRRHHRRQQLAGVVDDGDGARPGVDLLVHDLLQGQRAAEQHRHEEDADPEPLGADRGDELRGRNREDLTHRAVSWASSTALGRAMRTKISWSDGRVISKCCTRARADQRRQQRLRVGAAHLLQLAVVVDAGHPRQRPQHRGAAVHPHADRVGAVGGLDLVQRPVEHLLPLVNHEDAVAHPLGHAHVVGAEDDGRAGAADVEHRVLEHFGVDRVEPGKRLVEDQQVGLRDDGRDELHFLRHALRERLDRLVQPRRADSIWSIHLLIFLSISDSGLPLSRP